MARTERLEYSKALVGALRYPACRLEILVEVRNVFSQVLGSYALLTDNDVVIYTHSPALRGVQRAGELFFICVREADEQTPIALPRQKPLGPAEGPGGRPR